jgi:glycosyltransferase involved in cell wall biosynthesis
VHLLLINTIPLWGGGEKWTLEVALEFRRRFHAVSVVAADEGELLEVVRKLKFSCIGVPLSRWRRYSAVPELRERFEEHPPDLIVTNCGRDVRLANRIRGDSDDIPLVFRRGLDRPITNHLIHHKAMERVQFIIANSKATRETVLASFPWLDEERVRVIYNPIRVGEFLVYGRRDIRGELGIGADSLVIGMISRLTKQKGHKTLFEAFPGILEKRPHALALIVGEGELREELANLAGSLGIAEHVAFTGHVSEVQPYYIASDIIAIPSLYEGFCFTAVEAQLLERPVVASAASSLPEIIEDGRTGLLVPVNEPDILAEKILALAADPELRERIAAAGGAFAREMFDAVRIYDEMEQFFTEVASGGKGGSRET